MSRIFSKDDVVVYCSYCLRLLSHHTVFVFCLFFVCLCGYGFLSGGKRKGREILHAYSTILYGQVCSRFGVLWLAGSHGGDITSGMYSKLATVVWVFGIGGGCVA